MYISIPMKQVIILLVLLQCAICVFGQRADTFDVYFDRNDANVSAKGYDYIKKLIADSSVFHGQKITLLGYADYLGSNGHNDSLSVARARSVENQLLMLGFRKKDISLCVGKGKIDRMPAGKDGYSADRKVQIVASKNWAVKVYASDFNIEMVKVIDKEHHFAIGKYAVTQAQ